jgi:glucose-6-phosphate 1-dehydrogenase
MELKENTIIVVLGASGDLAKKKTVSSQIVKDWEPALIIRSFQLYSAL